MPDAPRPRGRGAQASRQLELLRLVARRQRTVVELQALLGAGWRTVYRDVEQMVAEGAPISLDGGAVRSLSMLALVDWVMGPLGTAGSRRPAIDATIGRRTLLLVIRRLPERLLPAVEAAALRALRALPTDRMAALLADAAGTPRVSHDDVLSTMRAAGGWVATRDLAVMYGITIGAVHRHLRALRAGGLVEMSGTRKSCRWRAAPHKRRKPRQP